MLLTLEQAIDRELKAACNEENKDHPYHGQLVGWLKELKLIKDFDRHPFSFIKGQTTDAGYNDKKRWRAALRAACGNNTITLTRLQSALGDGGRKYRGLRCYTALDVSRKTIEELSAAPQIGEKGLDYIKQALKQFNMTLAQTEAS